MAALEPAAIGRTAPVRAGRQRERVDRTPAGRTRLNVAHQQRQSRVMAEIQRLAPLPIAEARQPIGSRFGKVQSRQGGGRPPRAAPDSSTKGSSNQNRTARPARHTNIEFILFRQPKIHQPLIGIGPFRPLLRPHFRVPS